MSPLLLALAVTAAQLAGSYDGGQTEIAAGLELGRDGRFRYGLSYGALDEHAEGAWRVEGERVLLTSDPVTPPRFILVEQKQVAPDTLYVRVVDAAGKPIAVTEAGIVYDDGAPDVEPVGTDGLAFPVEPDRPPRSVRILLSVYQLASEPFAVGPEAGYGLTVRFEPNDLYKVDFRATPLAIEEDALVLERHGRTLRFRKQ